MILAAHEEEEENENTAGEDTVDQFLERLSAALLRSHGKKMVV